MPITKAAIEISGWKEYEKNTLRGFFTVTLTSGLIIHRCMLHQKESKRWVSLPAQEYKDPYGAKQYANILEFTDRETSDRFQNAVLTALDEFFQKR